MVDAREKALSLLKMQDKTENEMYKALERAGFDEEEVDETMVYLKGSGYIDDISYTERYTEMSIEKCRGPRRIRRDLEAKGVNGNTIDDILYEKYGSDLEREIAEQIVKNILAVNPFLSEKKLLRKIINKLHYEGFNDDIIDQMAEEIYNI